MERIIIRIHPDGRKDIHVDIPDGERCDAVDAVSRTVLELLGAGIEKTEDAPRRPPVPNGILQGTKVGGGS